MKLRDFLVQLNSGDSSWILYAKSLAPDADCETIQSAMIPNMTPETRPASDWYRLGDLGSLTYEIHREASFIYGGMPPDGDDSDLEYEIAMQEAVDFLLEKWVLEDG